MFSPQTNHKCWSPSLSSGEWLARDFSFVQKHSNDIYSFSTTCINSNLIWGDKMKHFNNFSNFKCSKEIECSWTGLRWQFSTDRRRWVRGKFDHYSNCWCRWEFLWSIWEYSWRRLSVIDSWVKALSQITWDYTLLLQNVQSTL